MLNRIASPNSGSGTDVRDLVEDLVATQPSKHSLQQRFYTDDDIYKLDVEQVLAPHWNCVGHASSIPNPGDYRVFDFDKDSVIVIRGEDNVVRAFANVCRHRGSRICDTAAGHAAGGMLICPYHAWTYSSDGSLAHARMMGRSYDRKSLGLREVAFREVHGLMFMSVAEQPLAFNQVAETLDSVLTSHGWAEAKVVSEVRIAFDANWKLALENQVECYHCAPSHPDFSLVHGQGRPDEKEATAKLVARAAAQGIDMKTRDQWSLQAVPGEEGDYAARYAMLQGALTASKDGKPVAPLMGQFKEYDAGYTVFYVGPLNHFLAYNDYGAIFRYSPISATKTELTVTWLVRGDAQDGVDYNSEELTWLWRITAQADKKIVEENQIGVASRFYRPGPYALPIEDNTLRFTEWYLHEVARVASL